MEFLLKYTKEKEKSKKHYEVYKSAIERNPDNAQTQLSLCDFLITEKSYDELFMLLNTVILNNKVTREEKISLFAKIIGNYGSKLRSKE